MIGLPDRRRYELRWHLAAKSRARHDTRSCRGQLSGSAASSLSKVFFGGVALEIVRDIQSTVLALRSTGQEHKRSISEFHRDPPFGSGAAFPVRPLPSLSKRSAAKLCNLFPRRVHVNPEDEIGRNVLHERRVTRSSATRLARQSDCLAKDQPKSRPCRIPPDAILDRRDAGTARSGTLLRDSDADLAELGF